MKKKDILIGILLLLPLMMFGLRLRSQYQSKTEEIEILKNDQTLKQNESFRRDSIMYELNFNLKNKINLIFHEESDSIDLEKCLVVYIPKRKCFECIKSDIEKLYKIATKDTLSFVIFCHSENIRNVQLYMKESNMHFAIKNMDEAVLHNIINIDSDEASNQLIYILINKNIDSFYAVINSSNFNYISRFRSFFQDMTL